MGYWRRQLGCPGPQRVTPGWLAAHPQHLLLPSPQSQASRRQQFLSLSSASGRSPAAAGNLSYAKPLQIATSLPCPGTAGPDRAPLPAAAAAGKLAPPSDGNKSPCGLCNCSPPCPWLPREAPSHHRGRAVAPGQGGDTEGHSFKEMHIVLSDRPRSFSGSKVLSAPRRLVFPVNAR